jgi:hypothetical protein
MLSAFPDLFTYGLFAPFVLRLGLAFFVGSLAATNLKNNGENASAASESIVPKIPGVRYQKKTIYGVFCAILAALLFFGLFSQVAALITLLVIALEWRVKKSAGIMLKPEHMAMVLAAAIAVSILFSGAGFFAFDLPL